MALIQMGSIVTKIRGKIDGTVFSGNQAGNVMRNKSIPRRTASQARSQWNNQLKYLSQTWLDVGSTDRGLWATYAGNFTFRNKLGNDVAAAPNLVFQTTNIFSLNITGNIMYSPADFFTPPLLTSVTGSISQGGGTASLDFDASPGHLYLSIYASPPFHFGKAAIMQSRIVQIMKVNEINTSETQAFIDSYFWSKYPYASPGQYVWLAFRRIEEACFAWTPIQYVLTQVSS